MNNQSCKICNSHVEIINDEQFNTIYYCCTTCQFIFIDEDNIVSEKGELEQYKQHNNTIENVGYVNMFKEFIKRAINPFKKAVNIRKVLDFGCGPGPVLAELLKEEGFEVDVFDPFFFPEITYQNKKYDLITSTEVFEHLSDPLKTLETLNNHLNKGGILAIMTLFHPENQEEFKDWWYRRDPTHISFYTPRTFEYIAQKYEMEVVLTTGKNICVLQKK